MRKVILNLAVSLDGYIEGPNGEYDWCFADQDYGMTEFFQDIDLIFMGRNSYDLIRSTGDLNAFPQVKYVFSDTLSAEEHPDVTIINRNDFSEKVAGIKNEFGGHIWLFGGSGLTASLLNEGLIDEFRLSVHPVILGGGKPLFEALGNRLNLLHQHTQTYASGLVQLHYVLKPVFDLSVFDKQLQQLN